MVGKKKSLKKNGKTGQQETTIDMSEMQMQMYKDKKSLEIISMMAAVLRDIHFTDEELQKGLEKRLYNKVMDFSETDKKSNILS